MRLAVFDLLGAMFAPASPMGPLHTDKLFARVCTIIKARFADPDVVPSEVAAEAGISLRYLQKLFTVRGLTCSRYIIAQRLERAAQLIARRALLKTGEPLSAIAYTCAFATTRILQGHSANASGTRRARRETTACALEATTNHSRSRGRPSFSQPVRVDRPVSASDCHSMATVLLWETHGNWVEGNA